MRSTARRKTLSLWNDTVRCKISVHKSREQDGRQAGAGADEEALWKILSRSFLTEPCKIISDRSCGRDEQMRIGEGKQNYYAITVASMQTITLAPLNLIFTNFKNQFSPRVPPPPLSRVAS